MIKSTKVWIPVVAGIASTAAVVGSAASLGTLDVETLGTSTAIIADCQDSGTNGDITIAWPAGSYSPTGGDLGVPTYTDSTLDLGNIAAACQSLPYSVTVAKADGTALQTKTGTTDGDASTTVSFNAPFDTALADRVTVTIYG